MTRTKFSLVAAALAVVAFAVTGAAHAAGFQVEPWGAFASTNGNYQVATPVELSPQSQDVKLPGTDIEMHITGFSNDKLCLFIAYMDVPGGLIAGDVEAHFDDARDAALKSVGGKLTSERKIQLNTHRGREVVFSAAVAPGLPSMNGTVRLYLVDNRVFEVLALDMDNHSYTDCQHFLNSFQLMNDSAAAHPFSLKEALR